MELQNKDEGQIQDVYFYDDMEIMCDGGDEIIETPQQGGSEGQPAPEGKTVNFAGKSFVVAEDIAQALTEYSQATDRRFDERSQELGALRQFKNDALQREQETLQVTHKQDPDDLGTLMFEDPNAFVGTFDQKIAASESKMRREYQQAESTKTAETRFWTSMWSENPDLARVKTQATDVIGMISQKALQQNPNLQDTKQVRDNFASEARNWMKGIVGTSNGGDNPDNFIEGSSTQKETKATKKETESRRTTKNLLNARRDKKRAAMAGRT